MGGDEHLGALTCAPAREQRLGLAPARVRGGERMAERLPGVRGALPRIRIAALRLRLAQQPRTPSVTAGTNRPRSPAAAIARARSISAATSPVARVGLRRAAPSHSNGPMNQTSSVPTRSCRPAATATRASSGPPRHSASSASRARSSAWYCGSTVLTVSRRAASRWPTAASKSPRPTCSFAQTWCTSIAAISIGLRSCASCRTLAASSQAPCPNRTSAAVVCSETP